MVESLYENNFIDANHLVLGEFKNYCYKLNKISKTDDNLVELKLGIKNCLNNGFFIKFQNWLLKIKNPLCYSLSEKIDEFHNNSCMKYLDFPLMLRKSQLFYNKTHLMCSLKLPLIDVDFNKVSLDLLHFRKYVVLFSFINQPFIIDRLISFIHEIDRLIESYLIILEKYEFIIILSDLHFKLPFFKYVKVFGDCNLVPNFLPFIIAYRSMNNHSITILDHYGTLLRTVSTNLFKVNMDNFFDLLYHSYIIKNDFLLETFNLKKEESLKRNYSITGDIFEKFFFAVDSTIKEQFLKLFTNFNIKFSIPLSSQIDINNRFMTSIKGKINIYSKKKYHEILSNIVKEKIDNFELNHLFEIRLHHINLKEICNQIIQYIKLKLDHYKMFDYILFKISDQKVPSNPKKTSITIVLQRKKENLENPFEIEVSHLEVMKNALNWAFFKNNELLMIKDIVFASVNQVNIFRQFNDKALYKKYKKSTKITGYFFDKVKYFLNYHSMVSRLLLFDGNFNLQKEAYGDAHITFDIKESDLNWFKMIIKDVTDLDLSENCDNKFINYQARFIKTINLSSTYKCYQCSIKVDEGDQQFYCFVCQITFCFNCGNHINKKAKGLDRLPHPHNLVYIPMLSDFLNNIILFKLGKNNMTGAETNNKNHEMTCNICIDQKKRYYTRYLCLNCEFSNERQDFIDICGKCFKLFNLSKCKEMEFDNDQLLEKYERFVKFSGHNEFHCLLKIYFFSGNYLDF